jgi:hypothetical protein
MDDVTRAVEKARDLATALDAAQHLPEDDRRPAIRKALCAAGELWDALRRLMTPPAEGPYPGGC